ncbi:MAG: guanylate kinase, partial [Oscillospiraceae bacterium]|nr:guanylate kinase [Oscillospiraceae bacterium]
MSRRGRLIIVSGPSGAGKSTVVFRALEDRNDICFSVSATTRAPRPGEVDGREYFFVSRERFQEMIAQDELLEHAEYVSNCYGTPRAYVEDRLKQGLDVILDIEIQGARQVVAKMPEAVTVLIVPPSLRELKQRLEGRGTEDADTIRGRLQRAREELSEADFYRYMIINDDVD